jgi:hypothetical protein
MTAWTAFTAQTRTLNSRGEPFCRSEPMSTAATTSTRATQSLGSARIRAVTKIPAGSQMLIYGEEGFDTNRLTAMPAV